MSLHRYRTRVSGLLLPLLLCVFAAPTLAGNWPGWRGPTGVGLTDEKDLPLKWELKKKGKEEIKENIAWTVSLKGTTGHSSPIVWGDKLFLTTADKQTSQQEKDKEIPLHHINCYQVSDGKVLWSTKIDPGKEPAGYAIYAVPTPVTDGRAVYAWFGSAVVAAVDFDGKLLWRHERDGPFKLNPGLTSSPVLYGDTLLLLCDQGGGKGWLQALDKKTGEVKWEQKRTKTDVTNTTPVLLPVNGKPQLIVAASKQLQALDPATGEPIWWCKARGFGASPAFGGASGGASGDGLIFSDSGNGEAGVVVDPTGTGDVTDTKVKWTLPRIPSQYGSAVVSGEYVYRASDKQTITCWKLATGEQMFNEKADGVSKLASPVATADGRIYFASGGKTYVLKAGPTFEVMAVNDLKNGDNAASPAVANGRIFIRGNDTLFCIADSAEKPTATRPGATENGANRHP